MEQTPAASSPAETPDVFQGQTPTLAEYNTYRQDGKVPERFKPAEPAESAPTDAPEETADTDAPDSDPEEAQEQPQKPVSPAEKRIKQLLAEKKELQRKLEAAAKPTQPDSSTAQAQPAPQNYDEWRKTFKPSEFVTKYGEQNPEATYEDAQAAMFDYLTKAEKHFRSIEDRVNAEKQALDAKVSEAKERFENFDEIKETFLSKVLQGTTPLIPLPVLSIINDSDYLADLIVVLGGDEAKLKQFADLARTNPNKAIREVARAEALIAAEHAKGTTPRGEDGKFKAPEKRSTSAPKPPSPVGGGSSRAFDVSDDSLSADEWMRKRNQQLGIKG
jgi:hypothetical protein